MLLVLDIGNTNIKTGVFDNGKLLHSWRLTTNLRRTSDEYGVQMESFFSHIGIPTSKITGIIMSSVIPSINYTIEHMCRLYFHDLEPLIIDENTKIGLKNMYDVPQTLGSDRICNAVAAHDIYDGACIVLDFGTATSVNVLSEKGEFLGGMICPGIKISVDALTSGAALIPNIEFVKPEKVICTNTTDAIQAGILYGYVGLVEHLIELVNNERGMKHHVIATGGMSVIIANETKMIDEIIPTLTLCGLSLIAGMNNIA